MLTAAFRRLLCLNDETEKRAWDLENSSHIWRVEQAGLLLFVDNSETQTAVYICFDLWYNITIYFSAQTDFRRRKEDENSI